MEQEASTQEVVESAQRAERRPRDMVISMLVLLVPILLAFGVYRVFFNGHDPIRVDQSAAIDDARHSGVFPVLTPVELPAGWTPVSSAWQRVDGGWILRLGFVSPGGDGAQVMQSDADATSIIPAELTREARPQGTTEVGGTPWEIYSTRPGEHALVRLDPDRTVIVVGAAAQADLVDLATTLS